MLLLLIALACDELPETDDPTTYEAEDTGGGTIEADPVDNDCTDAVWSSWTGPCEETVMDLPVGSVVNAWTCQDATACSPAEGLWMVPEGDTMSLVIACSSPYDRVRVQAVVPGTCP